MTTKHKPNEPKAKKPTHAQPRQEPPRHVEQEAHQDEDHPGSERHADRQREGGPRYHGRDWEQAAVDEEAGRIAAPESQDTRTELERADEEVKDPGTRGAVFGRGGKGIVQRDESRGPRDRH